MLSLSAEAIFLPEVMHMKNALRYFLATTHDQGTCLFNNTKLKKHHYNNCIPFFIPDFIEGLSTLSYFSPLNPQLMHAKYILFGYNLMMVFSSGDATSGLATSSLGSIFTDSVFTSKWTGTSFSSSGN